MSAEVASINWSNLKPQIVKGKGAVFTLEDTGVQRVEGGARGSLMADRDLLLDRTESKSASHIIRDSHTDRVKGAAAFVPGKHEHRGASASSASSSSSNDSSRDSHTDLIRVQGDAPSSVSDKAEPIEAKTAKKRGGKKHAQKQKNRQQQQQQQPKQQPQQQGKQKYRRQQQQQKQQQKQSQCSIQTFQDCRFERVLVSRPRADALAYAAANGKSSNDRHIFWVDGSTAADQAAPSGVAIVWDNPQSGDFADVMYCIDEIRLSQQAELFAIGAGLKAAVHRLEELEASGHIVRVFTDCMSVMTMLQPDSKKPCPLTARLVDLIDALSQRLSRMGVKIEIHWLPGHENVKGHKRADLLSRTVTKFLTAGLSHQLHELPANRVDCAFLELC